MQADAPTGFVVRNAHRLRNMGEQKKNPPPTKKKKKKKKTPNPHGEVVLWTKFGEPILGEVRNEIVEGSGG